MLNDPGLTWFQPPPVWRIDAAWLVVEPAEGTDFWQATHYGFRADNGHFFYLTKSGDLSLSVRVLAHPVHQYDQAGLMVRFSPECWLKTALEYEPEGPSQLGVVVTNGGYSDWSLQHFTRFEYCLRVRRQGSDFLVEHAEQDEGPWRLMRVAHLAVDASAPAQVGLYACSPRGSGFRAEFTNFRLT